jgi:hypothetical protein
MRPSFMTRRAATAVACGLLATGVALPAAALAGGKKKATNARVTGGGSVFAPDGTRVTHGFELRCDVGDKRQNLEVNWAGSRFHLEALTAAYCYDDPNFNPGQPSQKKSAIDSYAGSGAGRYNGASGATAQWLIQDDGEPGTTDFFHIKVTDAGGTVVLDAQGVLDRGNHQFHATKD